MNDLDLEKVSQDLETLATETEEKLEEIQEAKEKVAEVKTLKEKKAKEEKTLLPGAELSSDREEKLLASLNKVDGSHVEKVAVLPLINGLLK